MDYQTLHDLAKIGLGLFGISAIMIAAGLYLAGSAADPLGDINDEDDDDDDIGPGFYYDF